MVEIKEAKAKDLDSLANLGHLLNKYEANCNATLRIKIKSAKQKKTEFSKKFKNKNIKILVAHVNGKIIGYCLGTIEKTKHFEFNRMGYINSCFIEKKFRGKSIGKKLIKKLLRWFKSKKIKVVELGVLHANISTRAWRKLGFEDYYIKMRKLI